MFKGFRAFLLRGNVVDLAVAVVIGTAFTAVVSSFSSAFITPLIALIFGKHDVFSGLSFTVNGVLFPTATLLDKLLAFIVTAGIVFYLVVTPVNALVERSRRAEKPADPTTKKCPECLSEIPIDAKRCAFCAQLQPV
ncbi:MAG: large conductance mechanosensitive channel protein MscL [Chloroflexi bacterium]|jgi:large conductance mechanosensitive channel|nr:MAG: large conductance mechanosensitive channel protein MscL [Chloroflexota bacterium]